MVPFTSHVPFGRVVSATPNGRKAWTPLSDGSSASHGADVNGPTAVLLSNFNSKNYNMFQRAARLLNIKFTPSCLAGKEGTRKLVSFIRAFVDLRLWHVQFNVVNRQTLVNAQKDPRKVPRSHCPHRGLQRLLHGTVQGSAGRPHRPYPARAGLVNRQSNLREGASAPFRLSGDAMSDKNRGTVFNIQRYSVHDGPGIRTLVFLQGLSAALPVVQQSRIPGGRTATGVQCGQCLGCGRCVGTCPQQARASSRTASIGTGNAAILLAVPVRRFVRDRR